MPPSATATVPSKRKLRGFCVRHRIRRLAKLPRRVEILAEFEPRARIGLLELVKAENELSDLLGQQIVLVTPGAFRNGMREDVLSEARELYPASR
jgi:predicted nucleotidyltransferase